MKKLLYSTLTLAFIATTPLYSLILIDDVMTKQQQEEMGINKLTRRERLSLEQWLNKNFIEKKDKEKEHFGKTLYVSEIINNGQQIRLSDESLYEIAPDDWERTQAWVNVSNVEVRYSDDPYYPWTIINPVTGYSVKGRLLSTESPLKQEKDEEKPSSQDLKNSLN